MCDAIKNDPLIERLKHPKGASGVTPADLREVATEWERSAASCESNGWPLLAARERRFAAAMRRAADILAGMA